MALFMDTCIERGEEDEETRVTRERVEYLKWLFIKLELFTD